MQITTTTHFKHSMLAGLSLLAICSSSTAGTQDAQCQFSPYLSCNDSDGNELWAKPDLDDATQLVEDTQRVYLNQNNQLFSFNRSTGKAAWKVDSGSEVLFFFPILDQSEIYLTRTDGKLEKRHANSGKLQWSKQTGSGWVYPPVVSNGQLITGGQDRILWLIDSNSGDTVSHIELSQELVMPLTNAPGLNTLGTEPSDLVFASTFDGLISAYQAPSGKKQITSVWEKQMGSPVFDIQLNNDLMIAADMGGTISAINASTGKLSWKQPVHKNAVFWNVLHEQTLYSLNQSGMLSVLDINTGKLLSQHQFPGIFSRAPIVQGELLVLFDTLGNPRQVLLKTLNKGHTSNLFTFNQTRIQ